MDYDQALLAASKDTIKGVILRRLDARLNQIDSEQSAFVSGAAVDTNIAVSGITTAQEIVSVTRFNSGVPSDVTSEASITSNGNIQLDTTNTTGNTLKVVWRDALVT